MTRATGLATRQRPAKATTLAKPAAAKTAAATRPAASKRMSLEVPGELIERNVRDWSRRSPTMQLSKSFHTQGSFGPWIVTDDEAPAAHDLNRRMLINGRVHKQASTSQRIFNRYGQIACLSIVMTPEPGALLSTGTPPGMGIAMNPPSFLKVGDVMRVEIDSIGHIKNMVIAAPRRADALPSEPHACAS